jgi:hypothetical protein
MNHAAITPAFEQLVRDRAYALWESEGRPAGRDAEHWRLSEAQTLAELAAAETVAEPAAPKKAAKPKKAAAPKKAALVAQMAAH